MTQQNEEIKTEKKETCTKFELSADKKWIITTTVVIRYDSVKYFEKILESAKKSQ
jgi:hypothetical protein